MSPGVLIRTASAFAITVVLAMLIAACARPAPPSRAPSSRIEVAKPSPPQPATKPRWQAVPVKADGAVVPGGRRHVVKSGETGIAIAMAYGVPWSRIAEANRIGRDSILKIGQALFIPIGQPPERPRTGGRPPAAATTARTEPWQVEVDDLITGSAEAARTPPAPPVQSGISLLPAMGWPVDGRVILSGFGPKPGGRVNDGINIKTQAGATVRAAADGQVIYVGDAIAGFGLMVLIRHGAPGPAAVVTAYGHLDDALVARGQKVARGEPIARAGQSGSVTEPQLLFQVRQGRRAIDPRTVLKG